MASFNSRRGQKPEPLQKIDAGLPSVMLKLKEIADYLPETLKAKKSELDEIDFMEAQETIREYAKKLPPPESVLTNGDLIVLHNVRVAMEGSFKLMRRRLDDRREELDINLRKRGPQKPRSKRPAPKKNVPAEEVAAVEPQPPDVPDLEQLFGDLLLVADPRPITLVDDVPVRPALPTELFGTGFDDEAAPNADRPIPMEFDELPAVHRLDGVEVRPEVEEVVPVEEFPEFTPRIEGPVPPVPIAGIPDPPEQSPLVPIIPEIVFQEPSRPSTARTAKTTPRVQPLSLGRLLDRLEQLPDAVPPKRRRTKKIVVNRCSKRGTMLTDREVDRMMSRPAFNFERLTNKAVLGPRQPKPEDDHPCEYPALNIKKLAKLMPEFFEEEIDDRNTVESTVESVIQKLKALRGNTPTSHIRAETLSRVRASGGVGVRASTFGVHTPLGGPNLSGERISAPSTGGLQISPQVPPVQNLQEVPPAMEPPPGEEVGSNMAEEQHRPRRPTPAHRPAVAQRSFVPSDDAHPLSSFPVGRDAPVWADVAMDVDFPQAPEEFGMMDFGVPVGQIEAQDGHSAPPMGPPPTVPSLMSPPVPEVSPEEAARLARDERRVDRHLRRVGDCESTDVSTVTLNWSYTALEEELVTRLRNLWAADSSRVVTFAELCPPATASRQDAARTFEILMNLCGAGELLITQTSPQPQDIMIRSFVSSPRGSLHGMSPPGSSGVSAPGSPHGMSPPGPSGVSAPGSSCMSLTLVRPSTSGSSMSLTPGVSAPGSPHGMSPPGPSGVSAPGSPHGMSPPGPSGVSAPGSSRMSLTLVRPSTSGSSMSLTLDSSSDVSAKPSQTPSDDSY